MKINKTFFFEIAIFIALIYGATACSEKGGLEDAKPLKHSDPSIPVVFSEYSPTEGSVRTTIFIEGSNFGTDVSKISVTIGGIAAPVIGSSGTKIAVMAPRRGNGEVKVTIKDGKGEVVKEYTFEEEFVLHTTLQVNTLTGKVDPQDINGATSMIDGTFEEAEFKKPWWLEIDKDEYGNTVIYCIDEENLAGMRKIDITNKTVSTVFLKGQSGVHQVKSMTFETSTRDTLFLVDDNGVGEWANRYQKPNMFYALRNEGFRKVYPYLYAQCSYSAVSMSDGSIFYNTWKSSEVYKARAIYDEANKMWDGEALFHLKANSDNHVFMTRHPDDLYVYMTGFHAVYKCVYDKVNKKLISSVLHVGSPDDAAGYVDAPGSSARFDRPRQGVFVKNEQYVKEGKSDVYDYYLCDHYNHAIRKVTPDGEVTTFAGRGSRGADNQVWGWIDGDARESARFNAPCGICYDEEEGIFYVADNENKRIRTISID